MCIRDRNSVTKDTPFLAENFLETGEYVTLAGIEPVSYTHLASLYYLRRPSKTVLIHGSSNDALPSARTSCQMCIRDSHYQQKNQRVHTAGHMQVIAEPTPTLTGNNLQTVLQSLFCTGPPDDNARYQDKDKHQRGSAHNHFPPEDASICLLYTSDVYKRQVNNCHCTVRHPIHGECR